MAINAAFQPQGPTVLVGISPVQALTSSPQGAVNYRIRNLSSSAQYFSWGGSSVAAPVTPALGTPSANTLGMLPNSVESFTLPWGVYFIAGSATGFEVTPGEGL